MYRIRFEKYGVTVTVDQKERRLVVDGVVSPDLFYDLMNAVSTVLEVFER
jgi:hypothetical protein